MKLKLSELRSLIKRTLIENSWASMSSNIDSSNREQVDNSSIMNIVNDEELSPHLRDAANSSEENDYGPVPPTEEGDPYAVSDPYSEDWHVLPTHRFSR